jgi:L,D-peptidoglycan transpeptidase YkuD (ErfK/YbiS/YcfS/YnhG family)
MDIVVEPDRNDARRGHVRWPGGAAPCALGRSGVVAATAKREGDGATPAGRFALRSVLWRADRETRPETRLRVAAIRPTDGWCDDPTRPEYNRAVALPSYSSGTAERLWRDDSLYDFVVVLGHNDDPPKPGMGSAIFLHVARGDFGPTEGCIAMARDDLCALLRESGPGDALIVRAPAD